MIKISDNLLAAYLDGNTTAEETMQVIEAMKCDEQLREFIELSAEIDDDMEAMNTASFSISLQTEHHETIPYMAMAAVDYKATNRCAMLCELFVLNKFGKTVSEAEWETQARKQGWLKDEGMALYNIGRLLELECFSTARTFHNTLEDVYSALSQGQQIIVVVNAHKLSNDSKEEGVPSIIPYHAVVITEYDPQSGKIHLYNPSCPSVTIEEYSDAIFLAAWAESDQYMVTIKTRDFKNYIAHPLDLSDVVLDEDITELREAIAENAHEVWAQKLQSEGWTYGPERNDSLKQTPDMIPYSDLSDSEKAYDRDMAENTIKLLKKLGYKIIKE